MGGISGRQNDNLKLKIFFLAVLFPTVFCMKALDASAAEYYMRFDGTASDKSAATSCSSASTAMSVATHNAQTFAPGDTIYICDDGMEERTTTHGGTVYAYRPTGNESPLFIPPSDGAEGSPITYTAAPGDSPVIDRTFLLTGTWTNTTNVSIYTGNYIYTYNQTYIRPRVLWEDGVPLLPGSSASLTNGWFYYSGSVLYYSPSSGAPSDRILESLGWTMGGEGATSNYAPAGFDIRDRSYITVDGLTFTRCPTAIHMGHGASGSSNLQGNVVSNNTISNTYWAIWGVVDASTNAVLSDMTIQGNHISYCNSGISFWASNGTEGVGKHSNYLVTENEITHHGEIIIPSGQSINTVPEFTHYFDTADCEGISWQAVQDSTISDNLISCSLTGDQATALIASSSLNALRAYYYFQYADSAPIQGNTFTKNKIIGPMTAMYSSGRLDWGFQNNVWSNNLVIQTSTHADSAFAYTGQSATQANPLTGENYFINNSIYAPNAGGGVALNSGCAYTPGNFTIKNNIFYSKLGIAIYYGAYNAGSVEIDNNINYNHSGNSIQTVFGGGMNPVSWATWQGNGFDVNGFESADPNYADPSEGDLSISTSSTAYDNGATLGSPYNVDYLGVARPQGSAYDIGAYEYQGSDATPPNMPSGLAVE